MRTRFLNTNYFSTRTPIATLRRFQFLLLPPPDLFLSDPSLHVEIPFSDLDLDRCVPLELDPFPIEDALSQFLSDIIPKTYPAAEQGSSVCISSMGYLPRDIDDHDRTAAGICDAEVHERSGGSDVITMLFHEEKDLNQGLGFTNNGFEPTSLERIELQKGLLFEPVEVDLPLVKTGEVIDSSEAEASGIHFDIPDVRIPLDNISIDVDIKIIYPRKIATSTYLVDKVLFEFDEHELSSLKTNNSSSERRTEHSLLIPQFEVNQNCLDPVAGSSNAEALSCLLPILESGSVPQVADCVVNANEFLKSDGLDIMGDVSGVSSMDCSPEEKAMSLSSILEMDIANLGDNTLVQRGSVIYAIAANGGNSHSPCSVHFQEVQNFDIPSDDVLQIVVSSQSAKTLDMTELIVIDDIDDKEGLYQSFISTELALEDDTFKSLPTPILSDDKSMKPMGMLIEELLHALEPHSLSACDEIYLDWHPSLEGTCNNEICFSYINMLYNVSNLETTSDLQSGCNEIVSIGMDFFDEIQENVETKSEELPTELCRSGLLDTYPSANIESARIIKMGSSAENAEWDPKVIPKKSCVMFESLSQSNDLSFFLDVRSGTSMAKCADQTVKRSDKQITQPISFFREPTFPCEVPKENFATCIIDAHSVALSDHFLSLMEYFQKAYISILQESPYLRNKLLQITNDSEAINVSRQKLLKLIIDKFAKSSISDSIHKDAMKLVALYGIKKLAYFLCFFGIHAAHLYLSYLIENINMLAERLRFLEALLKDECWKSDKKIMESHPSLSLIESILTSNIQNAKKIFIVSDRVFWLPLTRKLSSMGIKFYAVKTVQTPPNNLAKTDNIAHENSFMEALQYSDCLLASYEDISASFPFNEFGIILEYGGPCASSRLSSMVSISDGLPRIHFIHVEFENHHGAVAFCEGPDSCNHPRSTWEATSGFVPSAEKTLSNIIEILNFIPSEEKKSPLSSKSINQMEPSYGDDESTSIPFSVKLKNVDVNEPCLPDVVLIVNTQMFEKKMLFSRRSSYKKILAMEKAGVQVVERDVDLALDLIFNAAVCLIWYEARNFMDKKAISTENSRITMFVENIATSILMSLSYSFSTCILIFEGESSFLATIMESSDALYAAAASLDMNLQLFCSHEPDSTDDIILSCITAATRSTRGLYPAMPESESIGESFLTRFPSINPLSAQAILSSGGTLVEFLQWSNERRIQAAGKYYVPEESVSLFSALCRYGEVGESKSVMTECSSIESDINSRLIPSPRKRQRHSRILPMPVSDHFLSVQLNQDIHVREKPPSFLPQQLNNFSNIQEKMRVVEKNHSNDLLGKRPRESTATGLNLSGIAQSNYINEDSINRINGHDSILLDENLSRLDTCNFLETPELGCEPATRSSPLTSRQSLGRKYHYSMFPIPGVINREVNNNTSKDHFLSLDDRISKNEQMHSNRDDEQVINHDHYKSFMLDHRTNNIGSSAQEKVHPAGGGSLLTNATQPSSLLGQGWFSDFFKRLKEKGNNRQQTLPRNPCFNCTRISNFKGTPSKSQSPSIVDTFRYQGSTQRNNITKPNRKNDVKRRAGSTNKESIKDSSLLTRTWTPIDKRARQNLFFTRNGNEKQSKLVWRSRDSPSPNVNSSIRKRYRDDS